MGTLADTLVNTLNEVERFVRKVKAIQVAAAQAEAVGTQLGNVRVELRACKRAITDLKNELKILWKALS